MSNKKAKIYFSYAWNDHKTEVEKSREDLVNKLYNSLKSDNFDVYRDKENCSYGESISNFIDEIGQGDLIVVFMSEKYAKSPYCMRELFLIAQNNAFNKDNFSSAILPVLVELIKFDDPEVLDTYFDYWNEENEKWQKFMVKHRQNANREQSKRAHIVQDIQQKFGTLSDWITDINATNNDLLQENDFEIVKQKIIERLGK